MLIVATLGVVLLAATFAAVVSTQRAEVRATSWQDAVQAANAQEARMMHEIRQAYSIVGTTPNSIDFLVSLAGIQQQVYYECDVAQSGTPYRECVRLQTAVGVALPAISTGAPVVTNLVNGTVAQPVFGFSPDGFNPTYVTAHLVLAAANGSAFGVKHSIVINDGAYVRNVAVTT